MAGNVVVKRLEKPTPPKCLLDGMYLWKWEEGDNVAQKMFFKVDENGYFLSARGEDNSKSALIWDLVLVSDVRSGKVPKEGKLHDSLTSNLGEESLEECCRTLVYRIDGITKLSFTYLMAKNPECAQIFTTAINKVAHHLLDHLLPVYTYMKKHYIRLCLESNGHGQLSLKTVRNLMMVPKASKVIINYFESAKTNVKEMDDGTPYIDVSEFTEEIYMNLIDTLLQNRGPDLDTLKPMCKIKPRKQYIDAEEFANFLNTQQRDPRLNDILHPRLTPDQATTLMDKHGGDTDRLTMKDLLQYLMSDDNMIIDPLVFDQCQDMWKPLNHYFINSSHNTYLNGHQVRSESLTEMYAQVLLTGCRCVELDCWPRSDFDDIIITHGNTLCTKVPFKDVVETINEFAFVASDYPVILSIENHCNKYPKLISRMAEIFTDVFGDKLLSVPFEDFLLEPGVPLPPPEKLKGKILIKDKVRAPKGADQKMATLQRGATLPEVPEDAELTTTTTTSPTKGEKPPPIEIVPTIQKAPSIDSTPSVDLPDKSPPPSASRPKLTPPLLSRPSLFKGMTILEDTDDGPTPPSSKQNSIDEQTSLKKATSVDTEPPDTPADTKQLPETPKKENGAEGAAAGTPGENKEEKKKYERGEALGASPLTELLNYVTAMSFGSFEASEKLNCHYIMSSFGEEKGMNLIKTKPKEFVRYNIRQNSRVYPAGGSRMNSSNYMPQIYWNVGCQMVALNFQTSDMPMQVNYAKFEMNGGTGYILKPSVMCMDRGFNPFVQKKIDDTVPARLSVKIISGMFITSKKTDLMVEVEMYGLPADIVRRRFTKKRAPGPHPYWDEEYFVFKRVLLPDLALLRLVVFDSDHVFIGQRVLPVNHLRAGFRHVSLRDKHNYPLGLANLFLHIKIEDYIPDEYGDFVAALENPLLFATRALEQLAMGTGTDEDEFEEATDEGKPIKPRDREASLPTVSLSAPSDSPFNKRKESAPPELLTKTLPGKQQPRPSFGAAGTSGAANDVQKFNMSKSATLPLPGNFQGESESCLMAAKSRDKMTALSHESQTILENPEYLKIQKRYVKASADLASKQDKAVKKLQSDHAKALAKVAKKGEEQVKELETTQKAQLDDLIKSHKAQGNSLQKQSKIDLHEKQKFLLGVTHGAQMKALEKIQKDDLEKVKKELIQELKEKKKEGNPKDKNWLRGVEQDVFSSGMQTRSELSNIHDREKQHLQKTSEEAVKEMEEKHAKELQELDEDSV